MTGDNIALTISVAGFVLQAIALVAGGIWVASKVSATADHLTEAVEELKATLKEIDKLQREHADRITRIEAIEANHAAKR